MKRISIRTRLIVLLSVILLLAFTATNIINYRIAHKTIRDDIFDNALPLISNNIYSEIQRDLMRPIFVSSLMAHDTFLKDWILDGEKDIAPIRKYLGEIKEKYNFDTAFYISDRSRRYYHFKGIHKTISREDEHDRWYWSFVARNVQYDLDVDNDEAHLNRLTIFINHRLNDYDGSFLGVAGVGLSMDTVGSLLTSYGRKYHRVIYLVDRTGLVQVHPDRDLIHKLNIHDMPGLGKIANEILKTEMRTTIYEYERDGRGMILLARYIPEFDWFLFVEHDETASMVDIRQNTINNLVLGVVVTLLVIVITILTVNHFQKRLEHMAVTDKLTGVYNRREFEAHMDECCSLGNDSGRPFSLILLDVDHFKTINDTYGHLVGDRVIQRIVEIARASIRSEDLLVRWGGDEFMILTNGDKNVAVEMATRIWSAVQQDTLEFEETMKGPARFQVTISAGVADYRAGDGKEEIIVRVDRALYRAKDEGRDRVVVV